jgi:FMN phosphatase YigB (HAD superfamily)
MSDPAPLKAVFFDIGNTLGSVSIEDGRFKLDPFPSSAAALQCFGQTLGITVGIITNIPAEMTDEQVPRLLAAAGLLGFIDATAIVTSRDAGIGKPDAAIYRFAAQRVGLPIAQCLYVGEDPQG